MAPPACVNGTDCAKWSIHFSEYAPVEAACPRNDFGLVRPATGLSDEETAYVAGRKSVADEGLMSWLDKLSNGFIVEGVEMPIVALTTSGGGYRSMLTGAGVMQGLDARDSSGSTSGLFQGLTYQSGLSGGGWLLSTLMGNNYPTISSLANDVWEEELQRSLLHPHGKIVLYIIADLTAKESAGYSPTLTDVWGRLLAYQIIDASDDVHDVTLSGVTGFSNFTSYAVPYPVIVALGVEAAEGDCGPHPNGTIYEFTPYEFGSWSPEVSAFTPTRYLGSSLENGQSAQKGSKSCTTNYDNLGYVLGTSSNLFNEVCVSVPLQDDESAILDALGDFLAKVHEAVFRDEFAVYPNPFYGFNSPSSIPDSAGNITGEEELFLVDCGEAKQNNPIFPFLQPSRNVSVILVNDNSADTDSNFPDGSEIWTTYVQAQLAGLTRMPFIPPVTELLDQGLNLRGTFFGCDNPIVITIVYLPNFDFTFRSGIGTFKSSYTINETRGLIDNGKAVVEQGGDSEWATCLGCAIMMKTGTVLPEECPSCFAKHCYAS